LNSSNKWSTVAGFLLSKKFIGESDEVLVAPDGSHKNIASVGMDNFERK
jgi:hypothetical protein